MSYVVERVAKAMFESEHPGSVWSPGRASAKWWGLARAAIVAMKFVDGEDESRLLRVSIANRVEPVSLVCAYDDMIEEALK